MNQLIEEGTNQHLFEIDVNDNYTRNSSGAGSTPIGQQLDYLIPDIYGVNWNVAPHVTYAASSSGFTYHTEVAPAYLQDANINWSSTFHKLVLNRRGDGSNLLDVLIDGKVVETSYMEFSRDGTYTDSRGTNVVGMNLLIGNQAVPVQSPLITTTENDGVTDGWTIVVQHIAARQGNITNLSKATP